MEERQRRANGEEKEKCVLKKKTPLIVVSELFLDFIRGDTVGGPVSREYVQNIYIEARRSLFSCACNLSKAGHGSTFPLEVKAGRSEQGFSTSLTT